jgi:hypothetical protein
MLCLPRFSNVTDRQLAYEGTLVHLCTHAAAADSGRCARSLVRLQ